VRGDHLLLRDILDAIETVEHYLPTLKTAIEKLFSAFPADPDA
jgi:hypothetical protein